MTEIKRPVGSLKGIGPVRSARLERLGVHTVEDLLFFFPRRYEDRRKISSFGDLRPDTVASSLGRVISIESRTSSRKRMVLTEAMLSDGTSLASALWFNRRDLEKLISPGTPIAVHGRVSFRGALPQFVNPELEVLWNGREPRQVGCIVAVYPLTAGLSDGWMRSLMDKVLSEEIPLLIDPMPEGVRAGLKLMDLPSALREMHRPDSPESWRAARKRLAFDELFFLQLGLALRRRSMVQGRGAPILPMNGPLRRSLEGALPFVLTCDQSKVLDEIGRDMASDIPMNRLLQGDVGSGKTAVALLSMMQAADGGCQSAMMVPTSVLAQQHSLRLVELLEPLGIRTGLLTGGMPSREKQDLLRKIGAGEVDVVVGTHALIREEVAFRNLGLVIVDEQHRFGVLQRGSLCRKGETPHILVMTATPIPRTLALSVYGDLSVSVMRSMPIGRLPVKTRIIGEHRLEDLYGFMDREIDRGRRIFWVCPIIEESEFLESQPLDIRYTALSARFEDRVGMMHGRMSMADRQNAMESFVSGARPILASTTVIEVGVDVPEATVMVIEGAERFGLSQLHQLRGRVGRGKDQSWCFLLAKTGTESGEKRLEALCSCSNGFDVAEADMEIRGPGEICGVRQHGITDFRVADLIRDVELLDLARETAFSLVEEDLSLLSMPEIKNMVYNKYGEKLNLAGTA